MNALAAVVIALGTACAKDHAGDHDHDAAPAGLQASGGTTATAGTAGGANAPTAAGGTPSRTPGTTAGRSAGAAGTASTTSGAAGGGTGGTAGAIAGGGEALCTATGGTIGIAHCCAATADFPSSCSIGSCGCSPTSSHEVSVCACPTSQCFDPAKGCGPRR